MRYISMDQAKPGMIVGKSVFNEEGKILSLIHISEPTRP